MGVAHSYFYELLVLSNYLPHFIYVSKNAMDLCLLTYCKTVDCFRILSIHIQQILFIHIQLLHTQNSVYCTLNWLYHSYMYLFVYTIPC